MWHYTVYNAVILWYALCIQYMYWNYEYGLLVYFITLAYSVVRSVSDTQDLTEDVNDDVVQDACCSTVMVQNVITKKQEDGEISAGMN